jgi:glycosyltransferase involved in cell wall biosynthesis
VSQPAPLSILHLASELSAAGSTISIVLLARAQRRAGHRVLVACPPASALGARAAAAGLEVLPLEFTPRRAAAARVAALAGARDVDVVNAHASGDRAACRRARFLGRLPQALVMTRRVMPRSLVFSAVASGVAADRVIAVSRSVARALVRRGTPPGRVRVVPNALDGERVAGGPDAAALERARGLAGWDAGRPTIGVVARRKKQELVLQAVAGLDRPVTVCCLGIEPDPALGALAAAAEARGHVVRCVPFQDDVRPFYALFDLAVLPSDSEGCSQAVLEAMALGVPIVATRGGGNDDVIRHEVDGVLVPGRAAALAGALARLVRDAAARRRIAEAARRRVREEFGIATTLAATLAVYREALARRAGRR